MPRGVKGSKGHQTRTNLHKENQPLITTNVINHLKEELLTTWETYLIPDYHRTVFLDCIYGLTPQQYGHIFVKEIEDLQAEVAPIQSAIRAIIARESCLSQIMELQNVIRDVETQSG